MLWRTHAFINLKTFVRMQNLAFVRMYTFRITSTESFIHEAPGASSVCVFDLKECCRLISV